MDDRLTTVIHEGAKDLIPHRPPMALVEGLVQAGGEGGTVRAVVRADSLFARPDNTVEPLALLEIIAQACAAYGGWRARQSGASVEAAFLAGIRSFETFGKAAIDRPMEIEVTLVKEFGGFHLFEGILHQEGLGLARANLKAFHPQAATPSP